MFLGGRPDRAETPSRFRRSLYATVLVGLSLLLPGGGLAVYALEEFRAVWSAGEDRLDRRANVLAEHAARVLDTAQISIDAVEASLPKALGDGQGEVARLLRDYALRSPAISSILLVDAQGVSRYTSLGVASGSDNTGREYFTQATASDRPVVTRPFVGRVSGERLFALSRRLDGGEVVAVMIAIAYFEDLFSTLAGQDGLHGVVTLYREDGRQLARFPQVDSPVDLTPSNPGLMRVLAENPGSEKGLYRVVPVLSPKERLYAYHRVPGYPLYVSYGVDTDALMEDWRHNLLVSGLFASVSAALLASMAILAVRRVTAADRDRAVLQRAVAQRTIEALAAIEDRETALRNAERAQHAKSHFLASASHDLRQPIQALRLFLELLDGRLHQPEDRRVLDFASKALRGAEDLLSALLDVSTLDAGIVTAAPAAVELASVLDLLADEAATQAAGQGLRFRYVRCRGVVRTDPVLLARVLRNLLANALRYTDAGGILLGCRRDGGFIRIEVWDTGPGIPTAKLDAVFEDFVQLANPERDRTKGLGLGLAVVRRMAAILDHPVTVRSREGKGTVFAVRVPRER